MLREPETLDLDSARTAYRYDSILTLVIFGRCDCEHKIDNAAGRVTTAAFAHPALDSAGADLLYWSHQRPLAGADLLLSATRLYSGSIDSTGASSITGIPAGDYRLTASHGSADNGISAYDASLALRHNAGLHTLTGNPLQVVDVNQDGAVSADHVDGAAMAAYSFTTDDLSLGGMVEGTAHYVARSTITLGPTMTVATGADVSLSAGDRIRMQSGFRVRVGERLTANIGRDL